jgi:hypothetical protein
MNSHHSRIGSANNAGNKWPEEGHQGKELAVVDEYDRTRAALRRQAAVESKRRTSLKEGKK